MFNKSSFWWPIRFLLWSDYHAECIVTLHHEDHEEDVEGDDHDADSQGHVVQYPGRSAVSLRPRLVPMAIGFTGLKARIFFFVITRYHWGYDMKLQTHHIKLHTGKLSKTHFQGPSNQPTPNAHCTRLYKWKRVCFPFESKKITKTWTCHHHLK